MRTQEQKYDEIVFRAAQAMQKAGASRDQILDRLLTYAAAQSVVTIGSTASAAWFRQAADRLDAGAFAHLEPRSKGKGH